MYPCEDTIRLLFTIPLFLFTVCSADALAQMRYGDDDTLLFHFDEPVLLTASRVPSELLQTPAATEILTREDLLPLPALTVGDALRSSTGTVLREYGAQGLQLAGMRGLGAEYTLVYLNGVRLNDAQNSTVDLGLLPLGGVEQIDIVRGGHAALYGSSALGGVVNIHAGSGATRPTVAVGAGSAGWKSVRGIAGMRMDNVRFRLAGGYEEAENEYRFRSTQRPDEEFTRRNASTIKRYASLSGVSAFAHSTLSLYTDWVHADVGTPGAFTGSGQRRARQNDRRLLAVLGYRGETAMHGHVNLGADLRLSRQHYTDPDYMLGGETLNSLYHNTHVGLTAAWDGAPLPALRLHGGVETSFDRLSSDEVRGSPERVSFAAHAAADWSAGPVHIFPALRIDVHRETALQRSASFLSPSAGVRWNVSPDVLWLRLRGGLQYSHPTFNQLYWKEGGNTALRAERAASVDAGIEWRPGAVLQNVDVAVFHHDITDKIIWLPGESVYWRPQNIQHVVSNGVEAAMEVQATSLLRLRLHGQWISARKMNASFDGDATKGKQLIYVPQLSGGAVLTARVSPFLQLSVAQQFTGERYTTESNDRTLPAYALTDLAALLHVDTGIMAVGLKAEVLNLFNSSYEIAALYPMPGRQYRATLTTEF